MSVLTDLIITGGLVVAGGALDRKRRRRAVRRELDEYLRWLLPGGVAVSEHS